jgi:CDP-6-deoxy-D-xylo-4-hexulose-3-dehydrase
MEEQLRRDIHKKVAEIYELRKSSEKFHPGQDSVNYAGRVYDEKEMTSLVDSALDFWLTAGRYADSLEKRLASFLGVKHCLLTNSGSSANLLAVSALTSPKLGDRRLKPGDEVITTACGFPTTLNPILQNQLIPVFVDVELGNYNIKVDLIEGAISEKTKAICIPHTLGNPFNIDKISAITQKHNLWLIEDNCDALGSRFNNQYTGSFGDLSTLSFYPAHHITMGEGGAVLINDPLLKEIVASFRDWGRDCWCDPGHDDTCGRRFSWQLGSLPYGYDHKYIYSHIGYNLKVTDMQAAVGLRQLEKLPDFIQSRIKNFKILQGLFREYENYLILPQVVEGAEPSWFGFPILVKDEAPFDRDDMVNFLEKNKIATRMLFGGNLTRQPAYEDINFRLAGSLENTDLVMNNLFWIGVYPGINEEKMDYVISMVKKFFTEFKSS